MGGRVGEPENDRIASAVVLRLGCERRLRREADSAIAPDALGKGGAGLAEMTDPANSMKGDGVVASACGLIASLSGLALRKASLCACARRHEVDFGDAPIRVEVYASEKAIEIFVEADFETHAEERRRFAILNIPRHLFQQSDRRSGATLAQSNPLTLSFSETECKSIRGLSL